MTTARIDRDGPGAMAAFRVPNYRRFTSGQALSLVGSWTETIAQAVLVLSLTRSPLVLGVTTAARFLPVLLFTPYAGLIVDRHDKRRTLMATQILLAAVSLAVGVSVLLHTIAVWQIVAAAVAFGVLTALDNPARMALIPELVGADLLRSAVTLNSIFANVGRAIGPVVAAVLVSTVGVGWCFTVNAASFLLVVVGLLSLRSDQLHPARSVRRSRGQMREGLRYALGDADLIGPLLMMAFVGTFTYEFEVTIPVFTASSLDAPAAAYGWLTAAFGGGAVITGVVLIRHPIRGLRNLIIVAIVYAGAMAWVALSPDLAAAIAAMAVTGACSIAFLTTGNSTIQLNAPPQMRGRLTALWTTAFTGSTPIGATLLGLLIQDGGARTGLSVGAGACVCAAIVGALVLRRFTRAA